MCVKTNKCTNYSFSLLIIEEHSIEYCGWRVVFSDVVLAHHVSISQKAQETLPEDGNVMSKHVGSTIRN
jgi:hypothetical protein